MLSLGRQAPFSVGTSVKSWLLFLQRLLRNTEHDNIKLLYLQNARATSIGIHVFAMTTAKQYVE